MRERAKERKKMERRRKDKDTVREKGRERGGQREREREREREYGCHPGARTQKAGEHTALTDNRDLINPAGGIPLSSLLFLYPALSILPSLSLCSSWGGGGGSDLSFLIYPVKTPTPLLPPGLPISLLLNSSPPPHLKPQHCKTMRKYTHTDISVCVHMREGVCVQYVCVRARMCICA